MKWHILSLLKDFPGSSEVKNLPANAGDAPGSGILEEELATHSSVLAWRIPGMGGAWWAAVYRGRTESDRTEALKRLSSSGNPYICI